MVILLSAPAFPILEALKKLSLFSWTRLLKILNLGLFYNWLGIIRILLMRRMLLILRIDLGIKSEGLNGGISFGPFVIFATTTSSW